MKIIAHRGASDEAPENTLSAIQAAIDLGVDRVEFDVRLTKDKIPVLVHDPFMGWDFEIPEHYPVKDLSLKELQAFDVGRWFSPEFSGERIPTLKSILSLGIPVMAEIKWVGKQFKSHLNTILPYLKNTDCVASSLVPAAVAYMKGVRRAGVVESAHLLEHFIAIRPEVIALRHQLIHPKLIERLHQLDIEVWGWTIDDVTHAKTFEAMGLEGVITNNVRGMKEGLAP